MSQEFEVFVPVRNSIALLGECLQSLLTQDDTDCRVTVVDDGSTDGTTELVEGMARKDPRLRYLRFEDPTDLGGNFTRCIQAASAGHFAIVHADDRVLPTYNRLAKAACRAHPDDWMIFCQANLIDDEGRAYNSVKNRIRDLIFWWRGPVLRGEKGLAQVAQYNHLVCPCGIYRTDVISGHFTFKSRYPYLVDQVFWLDVLRAGGSIAQVTDRLYEHRVHTGQASSGLRGATSTLDEIDKYAPNLADHPRALRAWRRYRKLRVIRSRLIGGR